MDWGRFRGALLPICVIWRRPVRKSDEIYIERVRKGAVRNGAVHMPKFEGILSQEAMWAIRSWLDTKVTK